VFDCQIMVSYCFMRYVSIFSLSKMIEFSYVTKKIMI